LGSELLLRAFRLKQFETILQHFPERSENELDVTEVAVDSLALLLRRAKSDALNAPVLDNFLGNLSDPASCGNHRNYLPLKLSLETHKLHYIAVF